MPKCEICDYMISGGRFCAGGSISLCNSRSRQNRAEKNGVIQGIAIAAAILAKQDYGDGIVAELLGTCAGNWDELKCAKVTPYDMKILRRYLRDSGWGKVEKESTKK